MTNTFVSLDGVMQAPGGPEEDPSGGFEFGGWTVTYWDEIMGEVMTALLDLAEFDLLLGRRTYEIFAAHWPYLEDDPTADRLNRATKYVASTTLTDPAWRKTVVIDDVSSRVADLKAGEGPEIQVHGSSNLIQTLLRHDLIDEFRIWVFPVVLGNGKRLFGSGTIPAGLSLTDVKTSSTGVLMTTYVRAGDVPIGSFALEEPTEEELRRRERQG